MAPKLATRGPHRSKGPPLLKPQEPNAAYDSASIATLPVQSPKLLKLNRLTPSGPPILVRQIPGPFEGIVNERFLDSTLPGGAKLFSIGPNASKGPPVLITQREQTAWPVDIHYDASAVLPLQQAKNLQIGPLRNLGPPILNTQVFDAYAGSGAVANTVTEVANVIGMLGGSHHFTVTRIEVGPNLALAGGASPLRITKQEVAAVLGLLGGTDSFTITRSLTAGNLQLAGGVAHLTSTRIESAGLLSLLGGAHGASAGRNIAEVAAHLSLLGGTDSITVVRSHTSGHFSMLGGTHDPNPEYHLHPELVAALLSLSSGTHYIIWQKGIPEFGGKTMPEEHRWMVRNRNTP